jgi:hypothetical protein
METVSEQLIGRLAAGEPAAVAEECGLRHGPVDEVCVDYQQFARARRAGR